MALGTDLLREAMTLLDTAGLLGLRYAKQKAQFEQGKAYDFESPTY
jgi:hypothetical protein